MLVVYMYLYWALTLKKCFSDNYIFWCLLRYVLWIEENIPKGGREISTLLERCIKEFKDVLKYKCDERYLQVWIKYVST